MIQTVRQKKRRRKRIVLVGLLTVLLVAAGLTLHRLSFSLQDISNIIQLAAGKISASEKTVSSLPPSLRGTIYDRQYNELSVSYQLFTLYVHAVELTDRDKVARNLASVLDKDSEMLVDKLKKIQPVIELADDLDEQQVADVEALNLTGVYCKAREERYYPAHAAAGFLLGYTSKGTGLAGSEALYDTVLRAGQFRKDDLPEINFESAEFLGAQSSDVVLTLDLGLQKEIEQALARYRKVTGAEKGTALVLDPRSGKILAMVSQPGFDPNYFWKADEQKLQGQVFKKEYTTKLVQSIFLTAAAIYDAGINENVLPATIRAPEYGLTPSKRKQYWDKFGLAKPVTSSISDQKEDSPSDNRISGAQLAVGLSSLVNGGIRVSPYILDSIYDHAQAKLFHRDKALTHQERIMDPASGVHLRMEMMSQPHLGSSKGFVYSNKAVGVSQENGSSIYSMQEFVFAAVPRKRPKIVLVMAVNHDGLLPLSPKMYKRKRNNETMAGLGRKLLPRLAAACSAEESKAAVPLAKSDENYRRFLISRRLDVSSQKHQYAAQEAAMPDVMGLSLRKGLRKIDSLNLKVSISGSGRIVSQEPAAGTPLADAGSCRLVLKSRI